MSMQVGQLTIACRWICSLLIAAPLLYWSTVEDGDVYHFLVLVVFAPCAAVVLFLNSLFCLVRYRGWKSASGSLAFVVVSFLGVYAGWYFLPQFRM